MAMEEIPSVLRKVETVKYVCHILYCAPSFLMLATSLSASIRLLNSTSRMLHTKGITA